MTNFKPKIFVDGQKKAIVYHGLCKGCGMCIERCPLKAIKFSQKDLGIYSTPTVEIDIKTCNLCGICEVSCPDGAIRIEKNARRTSRS